MVIQHDTTVGAFTAALNISNGILPPYAATFIIELYSDTDRYYTLAVNAQPYKNHTTQAFKHYMVLTPHLQA